MDAVLDNLKNWGCDVKSALERFLDDEALYLSFLPRVKTEASFEALGTALDDENVSAAFEAAHNLKGVLGNMGLTPMFDVVCKIVEPLRMGNITPELHGQYEKLMEMKKEFIEIIG